MTVIERVNEVADQIASEGMIVRASRVREGAVEVARQRHEIERLTLENWQLKGALGYPVPGSIPQGPFKCGLCDARAYEQKEPS